MLEDHTCTSALGRSGFNRLFICWFLQQWPTLCSHLLVSGVFGYCLLSLHHSASSRTFSDFGFCVIGFSMKLEISYQLFHCALSLFTCCERCSFACCWHCSFQILHVIDVLSCCTRTPSLFSLESLCGSLRFRGSILGSSLLCWLVMGGLSFHGTVGYYNVSCGLVCFSDHRT